MDRLAADEFEALSNDPLFLRLWEIRREVESGRADAATVKQCNELRETVKVIVGSLRATMMGVPPYQREKAARDWIQAFTDEHWPAPTRH